ncbi:hypothetical protein K440DRAFT_288428 [Wilcoxina mikolae CBS 423.85]|nr:hypothetical protein K440DRAFT_288428 [Wilcoxina mikolae CBS 423.85]
MSITMPVPVIGGCSSYGSSPLPSPTPDSDVDPYLSIVPSHRRHSYYNKLRILEFFLEELYPGTYLAVFDVCQSDVRSIDEVLVKMGRRQACRFDFLGDVNTLIIKCTTGIHETSGHEFCEVIREEVSNQLPQHNRGSLCPIGTESFQSLLPSSDREKQGDQGIKPESRNGNNDWPKVQIEVGYSETLRQLQHDAWFWLTHSNQQTALVVLISIAHHPLAKCGSKSEPSPPLVLFNDRLLAAAPPALARSPCAPRPSISIAP